MLYRASVVFLLVSFPTSAQVVLENWDFSTGTLGWSPNGSISGFASTAEGLAFECVGADPYITGPVAGFSTAYTNTVTIRMKSLADNTVGDLFYGTSFNATDRVRFTVNTDGAWHEYVIDIPPQPANSRLRLDPTDGLGSITIAWIKVEAQATEGEGEGEGELTELRLDNGVIEIGMDLVSLGGAITFLSLSGQNDNLINIHDRGREIQQSYYAGQSLDRRAEGQSASWSPWPWNPIQVGDAFMNSAQVLAAEIVDGVAYVKTIPMLWDMNNEPAQCWFEQWTSLHENTAHVRNKITIFRDPDDLWTQVVPRHQEMPAVYTIANLPYLYTYQGTAPWTGAPLTRIINDPNDGFLWDHFLAQECWAANVDDTSGNGWGVGVYTSIATLFVGGLYGNPSGGPTDGSTAYISPLDTRALGRDTILEYEYNLIVGTLDEIRAFVYANPPASPHGAHWWRFDVDGDLERWRMVNHIANANVSGGTLQFDITGTDPYMQSPQVMTLANAVPYVHLRLKNGTSATSAQLYWTDDSGGFGGANSLSFAISANDTAFHDYLLNMSGVAGWAGTINNIRLDPGSGATGDFEIDHIALWDNPSLEEPDSALVWVDQAHFGLSLGTQTHPYPTLDEGIGMVAAHGTVKVKGDTGQPGVAETPRITWPLRLDASGGPVRVGVAAPAALEAADPAVQYWFTPHSADAGTPAAVEGPIAGERPSALAFVPRGTE